jgi:hypothetical protein
MSSSNSTREGKADGRRARLEAQLKANLRRRKDQARARSDTKVDDRGAGRRANDEGNG